MTFKKTQVVMLPTNEKANLALNSNGKLALSNHSYNNSPNFTNQHLYFLSDEEIKEGDWFILGNNKDKPYQVGYCGFIPDREKGDRKVIATTDSSLREHDDTVPYPKTRPALPQPSQDFIKVFVEEYNKGNVIEEVDVEYEGQYRINTDGEPIGLPVHNYRPKVNSKNEITIRKIKDSWSREEVKLLIERYQDTFGSMGSASSFCQNWISKNL